MHTQVKQFLKRLKREEEGITALETAIILIAFVVVASVFAFTILSAGTFSTERGKEAIFAGLSDVQSSMEVKGSVIITATRVGITGTVGGIIFTVANAVGGEPINLSTTDQVLVVDYRDATQTQSITNWGLTWKVRADQDDLLESGELAQITIPISPTNSINLPINTDFTIEVKPPAGAVLNIQRTTPAYMELVYDLQ
jgi:archaeal flagellin FlaB